MVEPLFTLAALALLFAYPTGAEPLEFLLDGRDRVVLFGLDLPGSALWTALIICLYAVWSGIYLARAGDSGDPRSPVRLARRRFVNRFLALIAFAFTIYIFHFPLLVGTEHSLTLSKLLALIPYFAMSGTSAVLGSVRAELLRPTGSARSDLQFSFQSFLALSFVPVVLLLLLLDMFKISQPLLQITYVYPFVVWSCLMLFAVVLVILLPIILRLMFGAVPLEDGPVRRRVKELARRADVRVAEIVILPATGVRQANALVAGFFGWTRTIFITDYLLDNMPEEELDGVVAHELGHARKRHLQAYFCYMLASFMMAILVLETVTYTFPDNAVILSVALPMMVLFFIGSFSFISRRFELEADIFALELTGEPARFIEMLDHLAALNRIPRNVGSLRNFSISERIHTVLAIRVNPILKTYVYKFAETLRRFCFYGLLMVAGLFLPVVVMQIKYDHFREQGYQALFLGEEGLAMLERHDYEGAEQALVRSRETMRELGIEPIALAKAELHLAQALTGQGRLQEARVMLEEANPEELRDPRDRILYQKLSAMLE